MNTATGTNTPTFEAIEAVALAPRRKIARRVDSEEARILADTLTAHPDAKRIRVYSTAGFVANSYRYNCPIEWLEADRRSDGVWVVTVGRGDAKRSNSQGAKVTVDNR